VFFALTGRPAEERTEEENENEEEDAA
jgi:hypothetical protein